MPGDAPSGGGRDGVSDESLDRAADAVRAGDLVVYPTETVYGLGADALDPRAIERVFDAKRRDRTDPISLAVPSLDAAATADAVADLSGAERAFAREFLPGPVTMVVARGPAVPDALTGGRERVGVRVPDHEVAQALLERVHPLTATSANVTGRPSARSVAELDEEVSEAAAVVLDAGRTPGGEGSTVVDVATGTVHRRGSLAAEVEAWLGEHG